MCCEDCRAEKTKINTLSKILLNEHCKTISGFLGCDDCMKMTAILNDPIYKTLDPEQQQIYKVVKFFPFPKNIKNLKEILKDLALICHYSSKSKELAILKKFLNKTTFPVIKHYYTNMFIDNIYNDYFVRYGHETILKEEISKKKILSNPHVLLRLYIRYFLNHYKIKQNFGTNTKNGFKHQYPYHKYFEFCNIDFFNYDDFLKNLYRRARRRRIEGV